jgi:CheY-like chemotaxis protein
MKVLIVDDHSVFRKVIRSMLDKSLPILEAADGVEGLALLKANPDITLVLSDYNMPKMNGLQMIEALRKEMPGAKARVIIISSERDATLIEKAKGLGVLEWLPKPFKKEDLQSLMKAG